jgi:alpha-ketoglutaric semialdehyde dehydrogenase
MGSGGEVGDPLVAHADVKVVSFTGSTEIGRRISIACAPAFKRLHLEMGGKNAILVMDDADLDLAVDGAVWGAFGTTGQRCTAASRLLVHRAVYDDFLSRLVPRVKALRVGNGLEAGIDVGPCVSEKQRDSVLAYVEIGKREGAKLLCGGEKLSGGNLAKGWFLSPAVFADANPRMRVASEEIFGPVTTVVPIDSLEEGIRVANSVPYGLSGSIYTRDVNKAFTAMRDFETGIFYVNSSTIGAEVHLPFGGMKDTGNGHREAGIAGLDVFTEWKSIYVDFSGRLQKAQIDTHSSD